MSDRLLEGALNALSAQIDMAAYQHFMGFSYDALYKVATERWPSVPFEADEYERKAELAKWIMEEAGKG